MIRELVEIAARVAEVAGVLVILGGLIFATGRYVLVRAGDGLLRYKRYRLGRAILLGLIIGVIGVRSTFPIQPEMARAARSAWMGVRA